MERIAKFEGDGAGSVAAQVKAVKDDLDAHKAAQATKEKAVDDKLAVIQGEANVEGSIKKALADAKAYTDTKESAINGLLGTKEDAATVDTAFGRIAKEVARATAAEEALGGRIDTANGKITALENTFSPLDNITPFAFLSSTIKSSTIDSFNSKFNVFFNVFNHF